MAPALDIGFSVRPFPVTYRQVHDSEVQSGRAEDQVEIAERIDLAEVGTVGRDPLVICLAQNLGPAQRVLNTLTEQPRKGEAEELVSRHIEEAHRAFLHWVNQTNAIDEFSLTAAPGLVEAR